MSNVTQFIEDLEKKLPNLRPLKNFLHLNLYPDYLSKNFWKGIRDISYSYSFNPYPSIIYYQELYHQGKITEAALDLALKEKVHDSQFILEIKEELWRKEKIVETPEKGHRLIHKAINEKIKHSINELSEPQLVRFLASYFDQGISFWSLPGVEKSLLKSFIDLNLKSFFSFYPVNKKFIKKIENLSADEIIDDILKKLFVNRDVDQFYLEECLLSIKGWAAMVKSIQKDPSLLMERRNATVKELLAIRLILELSWIEELDASILPLDLVALQKPEILSERDYLVLEVWQLAMEKSYLGKLIPRLSNYCQTMVPTPKYSVQAFFCIDDRECSLRRFLEESSPEIETFGTPGHFGLDFMLKESKFSFPMKSCPAPVKATFILEVKPQKKKRALYQWHTKNSLNILGECLTLFSDGLFSFYHLLSKVFFPLAGEKVSAINYLKLSDDPLFNIEGGYSFEEAALRVRNVLHSIDLKDNFAGHIFIIGHYSTTTNNPYYTAYGCGACSGQSGGVNAQIFVKMANRPEVREILKRLYVIELPETTIFVAGLHDTAKDQVTFYVTSPDKISDEISNFAENMTEALERNALMRAKDFESLAAITDEGEALLGVHKRSLSIFEPRPELGHTNVALCVIGDRGPQRGFSYERRAFLQSYRPQHDGDGRVLEDILSAAFPVCAGISLDYFFSRMNNFHHGSGSKLSHNVVGLIGLAHGTEDDLLPGLAGQMVELHVPLRITFIIQQTPEVLAMIFSRNENLHVWAQNEWVNLMTIDEFCRQQYFYKNGHFVPLQEVIPC